mmetsp:Transcript_15041/g.30981  ORF Transcript_15041/g.30981 Transcript_15041/m.30981 type:complete len:119 (-) Transcript_15041:654-1010(-)|eukprot:CAMPEP_0118663192 /NCGR_PEP_ID=MMETSP0785-20121206/17273_1 /TAXON_ID=91992 /ORGANISM="Bolidomonas pacifica, Strain CCMP 1866" /LENGTH=118 /DNA_ID=CAMNT_0006556865 /DNA_START=387 /DNA_END=743 /DNA_ORIENTATION=+
MTVIRPSEYEGTNGESISPLARLRTTEVEGEIEGGVERGTSYVVLRLRTVIRFALLEVEVEFWPTDIDRLVNVYDLAMVEDPVDDSVDDPDDTITVQPGCTSRLSFCCGGEEEVGVKV